MGITTVPLIDGKPITKEQYDLLPDDQKQRDRRSAPAELDSIIAQMAPQLRRLDRGAQQLLAELDKQVMSPIASPRLEEMKRDYSGEPAVVEYIDALGADMVEHIDDFRGPGRAAATAGASRPVAPPRDRVFDRYKVNVIVTHAADGQRPSSFEESPSYYHMFGRIDYRAELRLDGHGPHDDQARRAPPRERRVPRGARAGCCCRSRWYGRR